VITQTQGMTPLARTSPSRGARLGSRLPSETAIRNAAAAVVLIAVALLIVLPLYFVLSKSLQDGAGRFVGLANFVEYAHNAALRRSIYNSLFVSVLTALITVPLAYAYSYALTRTCIRLKALFKGIALLPLLAPSLLPAISLTFMFGNQGFIKSWLAGHSIYGPIGIVIAQNFHCFPHAVLILTTALSLADRRVYEVAETLGTSRWRVFWTITFPSIRYGLVSAFFVVFTIAIVDFGVAKVIGGQYSVLAIDIFRQIIGQQNFQMGSVIGVILLVPSLLSFGVDFFVRRRQVAQFGSRATLLNPKPRRWFDNLMLLVVGSIALLILAIVATAIFASFVTLWPYNLSLSTASYNFKAFDPAGWLPYWNSVVMATWTAIIGTVLVFIGAYLLEKGKASTLLRAVIQFFAMIPLAVPGIVLGLGYVFFYNSPVNPLNYLYGSMALLVMCTIGHYYTVPHVAALTALKQLDTEIEAASDALGVPFWTTFVRVTVPICLPAILDIATYLFVNAMTTVDAVIFIYAPETKVASIAVVAMDDTGDIGAACAMALMIVYTSIGVKLAQTLISKWLFRRNQAWRGGAVEASP
jgi:iron(III) transport system permease protein